MKILYKIIFIVSLLYPFKGMGGALSTSQITGRDELFKVDVIQEQGVNKLLVKSSVVPVILGNRFTKYATNAGSNQMAVNGASTAITFTINSDPSGDLVVNSLIFSAFAGGIKLDKFLSLNTDLPNGILIEVKSSNQIFQFLPITNTIQFDSLFANGAGRSYAINFASGNDSMVARFGPASPFLIKKSGTYPTNDYIKVIIRDNISNISSLRFIAEGNIDLWVQHQE